MDIKIIEYKIIKERDGVRMEERIKELLEDGRQLKGDLIYSSIRVPNGNFHENYIQVMVKYEPLVEIGIDHGNESVRKQVARDMENGGIKYNDSDASKILENIQEFANSVWGVKLPDTESLQEYADKKPFKVKDISVEEREREAIDRERLRSKIVDNGISSMTPEEERRAVNSSYFNALILLSKNNYPKDHNDNLKRRREIAHEKYNIE